MGGLKGAFLAFVILLVSGVTEAAAIEKLNISLRDVVETVEQSYRQMNDVSADFFQRSTLAEDRRELRGDGEMLLIPPRNGAPLRFRFDYFRPTRQEIVSDGRTLWFYLPENRQVIRNDLGPSFNTATFDPNRDRALNFLEGLGRISADFVISFAPDMRDVAGNYILELEPRQPMAFISRILLVVRFDSVVNFVRNRGNFIATTRRELLFPILSTNLIDHNGNTTLMEFSNIRPNTGLPLSLFDFMVPAGVEVVRPPTGKGRN
jgi:outer membrane lipoprotein carrier protein